MGRSGIQIATAVLKLIYFVALRHSCNLVDVHNYRRVDGGCNRTYRQY
jgi:hypothetical protein